MIIVMIKFHCDRSHGIHDVDENKTTSVMTNEYQNEDIYTHTWALTSKMKLKIYTHIPKPSIFYVAI